jgi:hypothetical protein
MSQLGTCIKNAYESLERRLGVQVDFDSDSELTRTVSI